MNSRVPLNIIDTDKISSTLRRKAIDLDRRSVLMTRFNGSEQIQDLAERPNCGGFGRIRHFRRGDGKDWPRNPLPIEPACHALLLPCISELRTQVFQNAVCNWRCWYCFVDFKLLSANRQFSNWLSAEQIVDLYLREPDPPRVIDLTGGQPDLTPELIPWVMRVLKARGLDRSVYLWSDDNLSNDYFWRYVDAADISLIKTYPMYGRVCCFKGFDEESFAFNTAAEPALFDRQFSLFKRLLDLRIDLYAYVTLTCPRAEHLDEKIARFVDRLQAIHPLLPLRTVPLEIQIFTPVRSRMDDIRTAALYHQRDAVHAWKVEINKRFNVEMRNKPIHMVPLMPRSGV